MNSSYSKLKGVRFVGLPKYINWENVLAVKVADSQANPISLKNALGGFYWFFKFSIVEDRTYHKIINKKSEFLIFYGKYNLRKDHLKTFLGFSKRFSDADVIYADFNEKVKYNVLRLFYTLPLMLVWLFQMIIHRVPFLTACNTLPFVLYCYDLNREAVNVSSYKFVVVYYDASPDENFLVQVCKKSRVLTMTLQHGIFARKSVIHTITDTAFELSESISDYYLAWNEYTKDEAIKVGLAPEKVKVLGAPKYINSQEPSDICRSNNNVFGVILNNSAFEIHNRRLIDMANQIYLRSGRKYVLRYHPQMNGNEYKSLYNEGFLKCDDNGHSIREYAQNVSFTIISSSSVFVDLLLLKHPTYRLKVTTEDTYSTVPFNSFDTVEELLELQKNPGEISEAFTYLCNTYNVYNNYRSFFDSILEGRKN